VEEEDECVDSGSTHVFVRHVNNWTHQAKLLAPEGRDEDEFGGSLGIYKDTVVVGSRYSHTSDTKSGSAHVFVREGDTWTHQIKFGALKKEKKHSDGYAVGIFEDTVILGAHTHEGHSGVAHIYVRNEANWTRQAKLKVEAPDGEKSLFGISVGIYEDYAIVGAHKENGIFDESGSAYVFARDEGTWKHHAKLSSPFQDPDHPSFNNNYVWFGRCVRVHNGTFVVGSKKGEVFVFSG